jgi:anti-anti-sigma regulatory factor
MIPEGVQLERSDWLGVVRCQGRLSVAAYEDFLQLTLELAPKATRQLAVLCHEVAEFEAIAFRGFATLAQLILTRGGEVALIDPPPSLIQLLQGAKLENCLRRFEQLDEAIAYFASGRWT